MLKLFLLRHGKAANPEHFDEDCSLNKKGILQINQIGFKLKSDHQQIDQIISSSAKRTEETTLIVNHYLGVKDVKFYDDLYLAGHDHIFEAIQKLAKEPFVLYVGHNFGISDIVSYLSAENISMSTGMLVELDFDIDSWKMISKNNAHLVSTYEPDVILP